MYNDLSVVKYKELPAFEWDNKGIEYDARGLPFTKANYCLIIEDILFTKSQHYTVYVNFKKPVNAFGSIADPESTYTLMSTATTKHLDWNKHLPEPVWVNPPFMDCYYKEI